MIHSGAKPTVLDKRDYSFHRTFGAAAIIFPPDFNVDVGKTMPNQDEQGLPMGCTGFTQTDNKNDEDDSIYKPDFTYFKTCYMEGHGPDKGCDIRTSLKSTKVYGFLRIDETTDKDAEAHKGGQFFNIYDDGGLDWFDGIRNAIQTRLKGVSAGSPWFPEWHYPQDGVLPMPNANILEIAKSNPNSLAWHNYSIKGWVTKNGIPYLLVKSWQGKNYGHNGWAYMSREVANKIFAIRGSVAYIQAKASPQDIQSIQLDLIETVLLYFYRLIGLVRLN